MTLPAHTLNRGFRADEILTNALEYLDDTLRVLDKLESRRLRPTEYQELHGIEGDNYLCTSHACTSGLVRQAQFTLNRISEHIAACESSRWISAPAVPHMRINAQTIDTVVAEYLSIHTPLIMARDEPGFSLGMDAGVPLVHRDRPHITVRHLLAWIRHAYQSDVTQHALASAMRQAQYHRVVVTGVFPSRAWAFAQGLPVDEVFSHSQYRQQKPYWYKHAVALRPVGSPRLRPLA